VKLYHINNFDKIVALVFFIFCIVFLFYLALPNPEYPSKVTDSLQSNEPADVETVVRKGFYTNSLRQETINHYEGEFSFIKNIAVPTYRLNYPPEESQTIIRDQTRSTYLEEIVHPFRETLFVNGFEPKLAKDEINIDGVHWNSKVIVVYVPSTLSIRFAIGLTSIFVMIVLYLEYRKFIIELITLSKSIRIVHFNRTNL
jgi:Ca2+/Na+ antiporter